MFINYKKKKHRLKTWLGNNTKQCVKLMTQELLALQKVKRGKNKGLEEFS